MPECICCKQNPGNIQVQGSAIFYICGQSNCKDKDGRDIGAFLLDGNNDPNGNEGHWWLISDHKTFTLTINFKEYVIPVDKRVIKGLKNKIREIVMKQSGIEAHNPN